MSIGVGRRPVRRAARSTGECMKRTSNRFALLTGGLAALVAAGTGLMVAVSAQEATAGCAVTYRVTNQWSGGFGADVSVNNLGDPINGWTLTWSFGAGQTVQQAWNATVTQAGAAVTATS